MVENCRVSMSGYFRVIEVKQRPELPVNTEALI